MRFILFIPIVSLFFLTQVTPEATGQQLRTFRGNYALTPSINGNAQYSYYDFKNDSIQLQGRFNFTSDAISTSDNQVQQVTIAGSYRRGLKIGDWSYEQNDYSVRIKKITGLNVDASLDGVMRKLDAKFTNGIADGKWSLSIHEIEDSRRKGRNANAEASFNKGVAVGRFMFIDEGKTFPLKIEGQFASDGSFDGLWKLQYQHDDVQYLEEREYSKGFLIRITLINSKDKSIIYNDEFAEIREKLAYLSNPTNGANFQRGNKAFGILFDDGYRAEDPKLVYQFQGNSRLKEVFGYFTDSTAVINNLSGFLLPALGVTHRFQYIYPDGEKEQLKLLITQVNYMYHQYDSIRTSTAFKVNIQKNDSLAFFSELLNTAINKTTHIKEAIDQLQSGRFDYQYRDNFFSKGIAALSQIDTIKYDYGGKRQVRYITFNEGVTSPDSLVLRLQRYTHDLHVYLNEFINYASNTLRVYQQEEKIAQLDQRIIEAIDKVQLLYMGSTKYLTEDELKMNSSLNDLQLAVYKKFANDRRNFRMQAYSNTENYNLKVEQGQSIIDLMELLIELHPKLAQMDNIPTKLDRAYTRYTPNPFMDRDVVTRIKQHIYSKGAEVLLPYLFEEIKKANNRAELKERVEAVFRLEEKLLELAQSEDPEVGRLNTRMRRENQPERIRRLLGV